MHIAQIAPLTEAIPPKLYGGTERVVSWLTEELIALGHEVTLFASGDSQTSAKLEAAWPRALRLDGAVRDPNALHMMMLERVYRRASDFDVLHFHIDHLHFPLLRQLDNAVVTTLQKKISQTKSHGKRIQSVGLNSISKSALRLSRSNHTFNPPFATT